MSDATFAASQVVGSESKDGRQIAITSLAAPGQLIHKGQASNSGEVWDVITIEAVNIDSDAQSITILWGGTDDSDKIPLSLAAGTGRMPVVIKGRLRRGLEVRAFCSEASMVNVYVEVGVLEATETV